MPGYLIVSNRGLLNLLRLDIEVTNSPLAVLSGDVDSLAHCAGLCFGDDHCAEFLFSQTSRQCIGLQCLKKGSYSYQYVVPEPAVRSSPQMLYFGKETNWVEFFGHYYLYVDQRVTWADAKLECQKMCAQLVEIETKEESEWLAATFVMKESCTNFYKTCTAWTGGNDIDIEGLYVWDHSNTTIGFYNWSRINPTKNNPNNTHDCIDMYRNGEWNDRPCTYLNPFICEKIS